MKRPLSLAALALAAAAGLVLVPGGPTAEAGLGLDAKVLDGMDAVDLVDGVDAAARAPDAAAGSDAGSPSATEGELMARLRAVVDSRPEEALALASESDRAFPSGRFADERSFLVMRALLHLNRIVEARDAAAAFHRRFPESRWTEQVVRLTGYHPRRYGPKP